jgi:hypothetical protein
MGTLTSGMKQQQQQLLLLLLLVSLGQSLADRHGLHSTPLRRIKPLEVKVTTQQFVQVG